MLSSGAKRDMLIINMAYSLLITAKSKEAKMDKEMTHLTNKSHKLNRKIHSRTDDLVWKIDRCIKDLYVNSGDPTLVGKWVKSHLSEEKIIKLMLSLDKKTNFELLAVQLLFTNFCERDKKLHKIMKWLTNEIQYYEIFDLLERTNASMAIESTTKDSEMLMKALKG